MIGLFGYDFKPAVPNDDTNAGLDAQPIRPLLWLVIHTARPNFAGLPDRLAFRHGPNGSTSIAAISKAHR